jgi:hypothetical protein
MFEPIAGYCIASNDVALVLLAFAAAVDRSVFHGSCKEDKI